MPKIIRPDWVPAYVKNHDRARVKIPGRGVLYLPGLYDSEPSRRAYDRAVAEWIAAGRPGLGETESPLMIPGHGSDITIAELGVLFLRHAAEFYKPAPGRRAGVYWRFKRAVYHLDALYGDTDAAAFGPKSLAAVRQRMIDAGLARTTINGWINAIRLIFRWAVAEELVPASVWESLRALPGLRMGKTRARETDPVRPVPDAHVEATIAHLNPVVAAMVRVQRLTGARPTEVCEMTAAAIDTTDRVWFYSPVRHKNAHRGQARSIAIGPRVQAVLRPFLKRDLHAPLFSPAEAVEAVRERIAKEAKGCPMTPSRARRDKRRARNPREKFRDRYDAGAYAQAVRRGCEKAGVPVWTPNQLRHSRATELRKSYGIDAAGAVLGHAKVETTAIYAERSREVAARLALATG